MKVAIISTRINYYRVISIGVLASMIVANIYLYDMIKMLQFSIARFESYLSDSVPLTVMSAKQLIKSDSDQLFLCYATISLVNLIGLGALTFLIRRWRQS